MKRMSKLSSIGVLMLGGALTAVPALQARTCGGTGDVVGSFGWVAVRAVAFAPPGTTGVTITQPIATPTIIGSSTPIGELVADSLNTNRFASVGKVYLDGLGAVFTSSSPGMPLIQSGSYLVNTDCTISMTLTDAFSSTSGGALGLIPTTTPSATFEGVMVQAGNEIDLTQTGTVTGTTVTLRKTKQSCSVSDISSAFGISAAGYVSGTSSTLVTNAGSNTSSTPDEPFSILGRTVSDGNGNFYIDNIGASSPLTKRQITGTYTVNTDCTGGMTLITSDGTKRGANFVEVSVGPTINNAPTALQIAFTDPGVIGAGLAQQQ
jgi:hypothetical protein